MGSRQPFVLRLAGHMAVLVALLFGFAWFLAQPGHVATVTLFGLLAIAAAAALWRAVSRSNAEMTRFATAIRHEDLTQVFRESGQGSGFDTLGATLNAGIRRLRDHRAAEAAENRFAATLVDEAPTPILAIDADGRVELSNKAARRLFGQAKGTRVADLGVYGEGFVAALTDVVPGDRRLCRVTIGGLPQRAMVAVTQVERLGRLWRIVSVQIIQGELDAAEVATQADLVRVLTHEIMNSMTPVTSLAESAVSIMAEIDKSDDPAIGDARIAVETLARRAAGIMHFVESYREFSRAPAIAPRRFVAKTWADELARLYRAMPVGERVELVVSVVPDRLQLNADPELLSQVVLNLMKNGGEAASEHDPAPRVSLSIEALPLDRVRIMVEDNGPGVPDQYLGEIFLPFFTTKRAGTGVGLSFARQVVLLHHGAIRYAGEPGGGGSFEIIL
ncbi:sensor histidine kinase [Sphingomonas oryzagri]|uniref:histidine kinase n=1 Tax=Sphingomonas oryzagri TaxID=3042314 RepID=A0ABT6MXL5_9SPHN|nr:ATP-binding protein [Sphingomonas oryzagri]MDH7637558.1 ATP-binding protein [Sphingomonas oryzagri]